VVVYGESTGGRRPIVFCHPNNIAKGTIINDWNNIQGMLNL